MAQGQLIRSNQTRGIRLIKTINITQDSQQETVDLPRGPHLEWCMVRVTGTINVTTAFAGGVRAIAPYLFLTRGDWILNSNVTLDSVSGAQLFQSYVTRRNVPASAAPLAALGATSFEAAFIFDRALMDMKRPKDSMLKTDVGVSNNQLRLQFGKLSDMYLAGAGAATYTSVVASVTVGDYQEAKDDQGNTPMPLYYIKRNGIRAPIPLAGNGQQVKINTGNRLRALLVRVLDGVTFEPSNTLVSRFKMVRAGDTRVDVTALELRRFNEAMYGISLQTGQFIIDFACAGQLSGVMYSEFWPIPSSADTFLLVDTTASCVLEICTIEGVDFVS